MWPDMPPDRPIHPDLEPEPDGVMADSLLCMLMMCIKLCNLHINCSDFICLVAHLMHDICLFECQCIQMIWN